MSIIMDPVLLTLQELEEITQIPRQSTHHAPSHAYVRDAKAMAATLADVVEYPNAYQFCVDMLGLKMDEIKVQIEENQLIVSGERKRESEKVKEGKYVKMERRLGMYLKKFTLPETADIEKVSATYQEGVLSVTVEKKPPAEPRRAKTIDVHVG